MAYGVIYKITCKLDGKLYVGQTVRTLEERFQEHTKADTYIGNAIRAHGVENFTCEVIEECDTREQLNEREIFWIAELNCKAPNGYNLTDGGGGISGHSHSEETKAKMSASHKGVPQSPEHRAKNSAAHKGIPKSPETRAKLSAAKRGEKNPNYGKHLSDEMRAKLSEVNLGNKNALGCHHTDETRAKISLSKRDENNPNFGKPPTNEIRFKISVAHRKETPFKNLLAEMDARQITYRRLTEFLNLSITTISQKMSGKKNFTAEQIAKLVEIFDKPADYLLARD